MVNNENLYELVLSCNELTTKKLNECGFNSTKINDLIKLGSIKRIKRGYYALTSVDELFKYGKVLISKKEHDKAIQCFKKCYEIDPNHSKTCFQLFLKNIRDKDYENAFIYFDVLFKTDNPYYNIDNNFYLYLLSIITNIPSEYKEYAMNLTYEDIRINFSDKRYIDIEKQNKIRSSVFLRSFPYALKQLNIQIKQQNIVTVQDIIIKDLLVQAIEVQSINKNTLIELAQNKEYKKIVEYLEEKQEMHKLSLTDNYILKLANEIISLKETQQVPEKNIFETEIMFDAIDGRNYELALNLSNSYNLEKNIKNSEHPINLLLSDICAIIKQISTEVIEKNISKEESKDTKSIYDSFSFSDIMVFLMKSDIDNAFIALSNYMDSINKKEYEFLIMDLIKLSLIEKDIAFSKPMLALTYISRGIFEFDIANYIQEFYLALQQKKFDEARIYLDIISKSNNLVEEVILTDGLLQVLNNTEKMINNPVLTNNENQIMNSKNISVIQNNEKVDTIKQSEPTIELVEELENDVNIKKQNSITKEDKNSLEISDSEKSFIEKKYELLLNGQGIVLLKQMDKEKRKRIYEIIKEYPDMVSFSIGNGKNKQVVLRYKPYIDEYVDVKKLINVGNQAYNAGKYDDCIEIYQQLLKFGEPKAFVYAKLGLSYIKKGQKDMAIDYLTIATELSKEEDCEFDFTQIISSLKGITGPDEVKPLFRMKEEDFNNDMSNYYNIENIDGITKYILESGLDIDSACKQLELTDEQIDTLKLIYARECYSQGNYEKGDKFLKLVEKSKNKTKFIVDLFEEVRKNKKFYINRATGNPKQMVLKLLP